MVSNDLIARIEQNQISLRNKLLDKLRGYRAEQEGICADFVATNGPKLQEEEAGCEALALAIADARDGAARGRTAAESDFDATEQKVADNTAPLQVKKSEEETLLASQQATVEDLTRQLQVRGELIGHL